MAGRTACNDSGGSLHQNADETWREPSVLGEQPCQQVKPHSTRGRVPRLGGTSQDQMKPPVPWREHLYPCARTSTPSAQSTPIGIELFPVHPVLFVCSSAAGFRKSPCRRRQESIGNVPFCSFQ